MRKRYDKELTARELAALPDEQIDTSDIPELDEAFWREAEVVEPEGTVRSHCASSARSCRPSGQLARATSHA